MEKGIQSYSGETGVTPPETEKTIHLEFAGGRIELRNQLSRGAEEVEVMGPSTIGEVN